MVEIVADSHHIARVPPFRFQSLRPSLREGLLLGAALMLGAGLGLWALPRQATPEEGKVSLAGLKWLDQELKEGDTKEQLLSRASRFAERTLKLKLPDGSTRVLPLPALGSEFDSERMRRLLSDAEDPGSSLAKEIAERRAAQAELPSLPVPVHIDGEAALPVLYRLKDELDHPPQSARLDLAQRSVIPEVKGRWLDIDATLTAIDHALSAGKLEAEAVFYEQAPLRRADELKDLKFDTVLGEFETNYARGQTAESRTYNLRLAASKLDGTVLMPGEVFDFNQVVGPRDEANGYRVAHVIADGELVDGIGGGTCQISGTLHGAAFFAGLEIVERYPHTRPSSYIKMGMDATVVYPTINFRLKNSFEFPIVLHETVQGGVVRAEILGPAVDQVVSLIRKIDQALPYEELERPDPKLPKGEKLLSQRGIPGFRLHRYRLVRRGKLTTRQVWKDYYPPTTQLVRIGTGDRKLPKPAQAEVPPEYLADELLVLSLKRPKPGARGEFSENREKGQYGEPGWTEKANMPFWESKKKGSGH